MSTTRYFAPGLIKTLNLRPPSIIFNLNVGNRDAMLRDIARQTVDLAIMGRPTCLPAGEAIALCRCTGWWPCGAM